jgi:hypothetical protein
LRPPEEPEGLVQVLLHLPSGKLTALPV